MSKKLLEYAQSFAYGTAISADEFSDEYIRRWKEERDNDKLLLASPHESEMMSTIFCFADLYSPLPNRKGYEFDEETLKKRIRRLLETGEIEVPE